MVVTVSVQGVAGVVVGVLVWAVAWASAGAEVEVAVEVEVEVGAGDDRTGEDDVTHNSLLHVIRREGGGIYA